MQACVQCYVNKLCDLGHVGTLQQCQLCESDWCSSSADKTLCTPSSRFTQDAHAYGRCKGELIVANASSGLNFSLSTEGWEQEFPDASTEASTELSVIPPALKAVAADVIPGTCIMLWQKTQTENWPIFKLIETPEGSSLQSRSLARTQPDVKLTNGTWQWGLSDCPAAGSSSWCGITPNGYQWTTLAQIPLGECLPCYELDRTGQCVHIEGIPKQCPVAAQMPPVGGASSLKIIVWILL